MSFLTRNEPEPVAEEPAADVATGARLIPRITIQAFCENSQTAQLVESAIHDRRMSKVALTTHNGGIDGAVETYKSNPTPNLIIVETVLSPGEIPKELERLAEVCDASTRVEASQTSASRSSAAGISSGQSVVSTMMRLGVGLDL